MNRSTRILLATLALIAVVFAPVGAYPQAATSPGSSSPVAMSSTLESTMTSRRSTSGTATTSPTASFTGTGTWTTTTRTTSATTSLATRSSTSSTISTRTLTQITSTTTATATATSISNIILSDRNDSNADLSAIMSIALPTSLTLTSDDNDDDVDVDDAHAQSDLPPPEVQEMIINAMLTLGQNPDNISSSDALTAAAAAAALGSPTGALPPSSPTAFVRYLGDGTAFIENLGYNFTQVGQQCRGLQGTLPVENVILNTRYPNGRPAYALQFFGEWACQGRVLATTSGYTGNGRPLRGSDGRIVIPRSSRFTPILV
ncbi:hypothetical protein BCR44DRAFT_47310 [Catenaria anguillulae PL171]|uniref:Uncharacterized protein n=1 Tax=Catenaria anguillulae PL171 TaxID=765915 RepID=A0A1Y2HN85_9FUNG|nr:hypothetical protein BCR44DRAFT_47310 [Catenaria anguillulae PL171]